ncbi:MAG TPA: DUF1376 domain-containing protein [Acidobacteriaceae bacterium]|nr:DUF1376 domain-containing protein [Acidobacteriaceae bacterium]
MPIYIGDYLADTMHLTTEQHGAYLLLLFHLWRRGTLPANDASLAQITGLGAEGWKNCREVLAEFFEVAAGCWHHRRVERERSRIALKQEANSKKARTAAAGRWQKPAMTATLPFEPISPWEDEAEAAPETGGANAWSHAADESQALLHACKSESQTESESEKELDREDNILSGFQPEGEWAAQHVEPAGRRSGGRRADPRHAGFREILGEYWAYKNRHSPEMPWQGRDAKALSEFLSACPHLTAEQFRQLLRNRARSAVAHGDRVYLWIANLTRYQEEIGIYNKPVSAGGSHASRAAINRDSIVDAVGRALEIAGGGGGPDPEHGDRAGQAGDEPAALADRGMPFADGARSERLALECTGGGDHWMAKRNVDDGQAGADGSLSYSAAAACTGGIGRARGAMKRSSFGDMPPWRRKSGLV